MDNRINGVKIISANENISEGSKGIILEYILEGMAEYYSADLRLIRESYSWINIKCKFNGDPITFGFNFEPAAILGTFVFRGFFMPEYCFLRRYSSLSNNLSLSTANNPAPIAPQNSGLSDMKIFVFNRFCNTFFKNMFSGR